MPSAGRHRGAAVPVRRSLELSILAPPDARPPAMLRGARAADRGAGPRLYMIVLHHFSML